MVQFPPSGEKSVLLYVCPLHTDMQKAIQVEDGVLGGMPSRLHAAGSHVIFCDPASRPAQKTFGVFNLYLELNTSKTKEMGCHRVENRGPSCAFLPPALQAGYTSRASGSHGAKMSCGLKPHQLHIMYSMYCSLVHT